MNLLVDAGNTTVKFGLVEDDVITQILSLSTISFSKTEVERLLKQYYPFQTIGVATVSLSTNEILDIIPHQKQVNISASAKLPFDIYYKTPETLGADRLSVVAGALSQTSKKNILIIDAGSAITYEFVENGIYLGGNISPGLRLRFEALHQFTSRLPLLQPQSPRNKIGTTTNEAINNGVVWGIRNEIEQTIASFQQQNTENTVFLTGGDAFFLQGLLKSNIFVEPNLTLLGILEILTHNND
jgi:type III pantothenate kinase